MGSRGRREERKFPSDGLCFPGKKRQQGQHMKEAGGEGVRGTIEDPPGLTVAPLRGETARAARSPPVSFRFGREGRRARRNSDEA